ncbi:MAG: glycerate kinase, partial [Oscillospiraceae bacterium]
GGGKPAGLPRRRARQRGEPVSAMELRKCIVLSDSFKGTLSSREICRITREVAAERIPGCDFTALPVADGGEGTADCFLDGCGGEAVSLSVTGPFPGERRTAVYAMLPDRTAVVECASCAGLPLAEGRLDPCRTTTFGVGEQLRHAAEHGARRIILGLGGSATNDGGCGAAAALGVRFLDEQGESFIPTGGTLHRVHRIDPAPARALLAGIPMTVMCDIDNPLFGPQGAAYVFAPQKGADAAAVRLLDEGLRSLDAAMERSLGRSFAYLPGAGAAGGFGAGCAAFFGGQLRSGIETVLDQLRFDERLRGCDLVVTGEGRLDGQSLRGKVVAGVAKRAKRQGVPVAALVGAVTEESEPLYELGVSAVFTINRRPQELRRSGRHAAENYRRSFDDLLRLVLAIGQRG